MRPDSQGRSSAVRSRTGLQLADLQLADLQLADLLRALAQLEFLDLARRGFWQRSEDDRPRYLVMGEVGAAPGDDVIAGNGAGAGLRLERDKSARGLAPDRVGPGDDRRLHHLRMAIERILDFERGDVLAARDDDVLRAVLDLDIAVGVADGEVAGVEPVVL